MLASWSGSLHPLQHVAATLSSRDISAIDAAWRARRQLDLPPVLPHLEMLPPTQVDLRAF
jgi:hypothetical protein